MSEGKQTLIEEGTVFKGMLASNCPIVVKGKVEGEVSGPSLQVSATGAVSGTVKVGEINSEGELAGEYEADVVRLSGRVKDHTVIRAKSLEMKLTPQKGRMEVMFGECELQVGDEPSRRETRGAGDGRASGDEAGKDGRSAETVAEPAGASAEGKPEKGGKEGRASRNNANAAG